MSIARFRFCSPPMTIRVADVLSSQTKMGSATWNISRMMKWVMRKSSRASCKATISAAVEEEAMIVCFLTPQTMGLPNRRMRYPKLSAQGGGLGWHRRHQGRRPARSMHLRMRPIFCQLNGWVRRSLACLLDSGICAGRNFFQQRSRCSANDWGHSPRMRYRGGSCGRRRGVRQS